jgi:c-di-GMP phosphodiesterase
MGILLNALQSRALYRVLRFVQMTQALGQTGFSFFIWHSRKPRATPIFYWYKRVHPFSEVSMLSKYLKFFGGSRTSAQNDAEIDAPQRPAPIDRVVPLMDAPARERVAPSGLIDTEEAGTVVTHMLDIPTHGERTRVTDLLNRFLGRQPLLDRSGDITAYELRIKKTVPATDSASARTLQQMYEETLLASMLDLDIALLRGEKLIFATVGPATLDTHFLDRLDGEGIVLIFSPPEGDIAALVARCHELHDRGYRFGLENVQYREALDELLPMVDYLRIDAAAYDAMQLGELVGNLRRHGDFKLLANRVETEELYEVCRKLSFDYFQGYFFAKPLPVPAQKVDSQRLRVMQLLNQTLNHAEIAELEDSFKRDPVLSYKLLRFINSPATGLLQPVRSIAHGLVVLGYDQLYRWLTLLLFASGQPDHRTLALMKTALIRARLTELLGQKRITGADREGLFITGIFSLLDALLNMPMARALESLKMPAAIEAALLRQEGIYAPYLDLAIACEESEQEVIASYLAAGKISAEELNTAHVQAIIWAEDVNL